MRLPVSAANKLTYTTTIPIRWGDMDPMGHVNNTLYFRYMEIVRLEWLCSIGAAPQPQGCAPVIVNAYCNFLQQLQYPGDIVAKHYVGHAGRSSFDTYMTLERSDAPGLVYADGGATTVWTDLKAQKSVPIPDWLRALLG